MGNAKGQALGSIFGETKRRSRAATAAPPPSAAAAAFVPPGLAGFFGALDRLEAVIDSETEALTRSIPADMTDLGNRKRQGLLELTRSLKAAAGTGAVAEIRERLGRFSLKLERNRAMLGTQMRAVNEIAEIIARTIKDAESDGTYSLRIGRS